MKKAFYSLRKKFHHRSLSNLLANQRFRRQSMPFDQVRSIGILFDATELAIRNQVMAYADTLKKAGKQVRLLGFADQAETPDSFPFKAFNPKGLDWMLRPTGPDVEDFIQQPFDLLFLLSFDDILPLQYIAALSRAHFRVGPYSNHGPTLELMIDMPKGKGLPEFIQQAESFLHKMQSTYESAAV